MTTVVAVKRVSYLAIATTTLTLGTHCTSSGIGLVSMGDDLSSIVGWSGSSAVRQAFEQWAKESAARLKHMYCGTRAESARAWREFMRFAKDEGGAEVDADQANMVRLELLGITVATGIRHHTRYGAVLDYDSCAAIGSGREYALGAAAVLLAQEFPPEAQDIVRQAVWVAREHDALSTGAIISNEMECEQCA